MNCMRPCCFSLCSCELQAIGTSGDFLKLVEEKCGATDQESLVKLLVVRFRNFRSFASCCIPDFPSKIQSRGLRLETQNANPTWILRMQGRRAELRLRGSSIGSSQGSSEGCKHTKAIGAVGVYMQRSMCAAMAFRNDFAV